MLDILIKNANIITMNDALPVISGGCIGIENGKISFVSDKNSPEMQIAAERIIDADGNIVMPGLINTHAHTAMCIMRGYADDYALNDWLFKKIFPVEGRLTREAVLAGVRLGIAEMLASGTTSFSDMYFFEPDSAAVAAEIGIRASLCNSVLALGDDYDFEQDRAVIETRALIRDWHLAANGRIRADVGIHAEYTSRPEHWRKVSELAEKHNLVTQIHLSETKRETDECIARYGKTPTEILNENGVFNTRTLAAHGVYLTNRDMSILARRGVSVAHNPVSNLKLASGIANVTAMLKSGVNVSLGTDGCASRLFLLVVAIIQACPGALHQPRESAQFPEGHRLKHAFYQREKRCQLHLFARQTIGNERFAAFTGGVEQSGSEHRADKTANIQRCFVGGRTCRPHSGFLAVIVVAKGMTDGLNGCFIEGC